MARYLPPATSGTDCTQGDAVAAAVAPAVVLVPSGLVVVPLAEQRVSVFEGASSEPLQGKNT